MAYDPTGIDMSDEDVQRDVDLRANNYEGLRNDKDYQASRQEREAKYGLAEKELAQQRELAELGERGANSRASTSAGASRYAANASAGASRYASDASVKNAKLQAETQRYGIDIDRLTDQEKIALDRQLGLGGLGVDLVKTAASLTGPEDVFKYVDLIRGGRGLGGAPYFLGALTGAPGGGQIAGFQAPGGTPTPLTMDSLLKGLGAAGGGGVTSNGSMTDVERNADAFKTNLGSLLAGGIHKFQPGSLERLNPSEMGLLQGAAGKLGYNFDDLMATYSRAGIGQGNASMA